MSYNPTVKRYSQDMGVAIPIVRWSESEFPRLNTTPAPYLPLQLENDRHGEHYVVLTGKPLALDAMGFLVPAGLKLQMDALAAIRAGTNTWTALLAAYTINRYDANDVANGVVNARGVLAQLNEPVIFSLVTDAACVPANTVAGTALPVASNPITISSHIGVAPYSMLRAASDVMSRSANDMLPSATGVAATQPYDPTQLRNLAWELQNRATVLVDSECLIYPVVANRTYALIEGQAFAIGASMAAFELGGYVTYNEDSDIVPLTSTCAAVVLTAPTYASATVGALAQAALLATLKGGGYILGQVIRKNVRFPSSLLDKVKTRWDNVPGMTQLDKMPGSATDGYPWHMHTAGAYQAAQVFGEIQISPRMR